MRTWIAALALSLLALSGCGDDDAEARARGDRLARSLTPVEVTYEVEGTGEYDPPTADLTMATPTGTEQAAAILPLVNQSGSDGLRFSFPPGSFVYVSAQMSEYGKEITCRITVDGEIISENTSTTNYGIATCKGSV